MSTCGSDEFQTLDTHHDSLMIDVIVINRTEDTARLDFMTTQLGKLGLDFLRLDATVPQTLPKDVPAGYWSRGDRPLTVKDRARFISHSRAWDWVATNGPALILEDDALLSNQVANILNNVAGTPTIEHLSLEARGKRKILDNKAIPIGDHISAHRMYLDRSGAAAYVLWPHGAKKLLRRSAKRPAKADLMIRRSFDLSSYQAVPALAVQFDMADQYGLPDPQINGQTMDDQTPTKMTTRQFMRRATSRARITGRKFRYRNKAKAVRVPVDPELFEL